MEIKEKLKNIPREPGIYLMKNAKAAIIYVGKAKNLKNRVSSYFVGTDSLNAKTRKLVADIVDYDIILTKTEVEALLLERTLIRHHQPPFNILLRDDREYPLLRVNFKDPWPRINIVRRKQNDNASYFGPFSQTGYLRTMVDAAYKVFPLIRCSQYDFEHAKKPCNYYQMKSCLGPCVLPVDRLAYNAMIEDAVNFVQGKNKVLEKSLQQKMEKASEDEDYEQAIRYRDQLTALANLREKQAVVVPPDVEADAVSIVQNENFSSVYVLLIREGRLMGKDMFLIEQPIPVDSQEALKAFLMQYYDGRNLPNEILLPFEISEQEDFLTLINQIGHGKVRFFIPQKGVKKDLLDMSRRNAQYSFDEEQRKRTQDFTQLELLREKFHLKRLPKRMECIDISHIQGTAVVASDVCFIDGKPAKNLYRHYAIQTELAYGGDDYESIREVVRRRMTRAVRDHDICDLLVIDGGKQQLNAALEVIKTFPDLDFDVMGLAKSRSDAKKITEKFTPSSSLERVFQPGLDYSIPLVEGSPEFRVLTQIRNEAHRFAITYHRKKRDKKARSSTLEEISGVGPTLRKRLLEHFVSIESLQKATFEQLRAVPGLTPSTAEKIIKHFTDSVN